MRNVRDPEIGIISRELREEAQTDDWTRPFPELRLILDVHFNVATQKLRENSTQGAQSRDREGKLRGSIADHRGQLLLSGLIE